MIHRILDVGDRAFTIELGDAIDPAIHVKVSALDHAVAGILARGELRGVIETVPTFRSLTVIYDPLITERSSVLAQIEPLVGATDLAPTGDTRQWRLPTCYSGDAAPDLVAIAETLGLDPDAVVHLHSGTEFVVYMLGFLPGFPFMGDLPDALHLPRRSEPRVRVPAGSVAIATGLTAIYPWESPGGWHLIGRCPVPLFDPARPCPALLQVADRVRFDPVSPTEYARLERALAARELDPACWCTDPDKQAGAPA